MNSGSGAHCYRCGRDFANIVDKTWGIVYDKCLGKECFKCKKIRKLKAVEITYFSQGAFPDGCPKCKRQEDKRGERIHVLKNDLCPDCFWETEEEKGCICVLEDRNTGLWCSFCQEVHFFNPACKECLEKQNWLFEAQQGKLGWFYNPKNLWMLLLIGVVLFAILGFVVGSRFKETKKIYSNRMG